MHLVTIALNMKVRAIRNKMLPIKEYLNKIRPYLSNMINNLETQGKWKIQLSIAINFLSSKDNNKICTIHSNCDNKEIMIGNETTLMKKLTDV